MKITCKSILSHILYVVKLLGIAIMLAIVLRVFFIASFKIPSYSMAPALDAGDYILVNKAVLGARVYKNFDFQKGGQVETKRLWGWRKTVYLAREVLQRYVFQKNYYFMAGDYVSDSRDSRYWGLLPEEHIVGKAAVIWQSKDMNTGKRRWERF
ncbi:hypothetical protein FACS189463_0590 [Bacteroidia bacterium]|nr:hypothetical protein FACS189463_0590 [Bacteroidia bacterium]